MSLAGKVVLVAGASSGMGRATAIAAAAGGAKVALFARREQELAALAKQLDATFVAGDATDATQAGRAVLEAVDACGRVDVLVNCVGTNVKQRALTDLSSDGWRNLISVNLDAAYVLTQAALPTFRQQQNGLLIHVSSVAAKRPDRSGVGYQASKAGVAALAFGTMEEERGNGVRVTVIYPGLTDTALVEQRPVPPTKEELAKALQPEDIAELCVATMSLPERAHVSEIVVHPSQL
ncbi:SDR family oxidoreductase [Tenggerimyces flavus]|uniref:SDR family oxidoreductase n=1 Tax=Tenggerimyces flavus TaxID=1708749 RepID=A0ABV7Y8P5_9ACTN|nr:SDR family NAD(P)-dependent oxidoreductase [Tenggerimyces flavus]MBM7785162.1 NADP-dependent 3-hydroxy acid dehydrogenase YdfG [Tenggerimyces flavus]